jgi:hypothetical protein
MNEEIFDRASAWGSFCGSMGYEDVNPYPIGSDEWNNYKQAYKIQKTIRDNDEKIRDEMRETYRR